MFDDQYEDVYANVPISDVKPLEFATAHAGHARRDRSIRQRDR